MRCNAQCYQPMRAPAYLAGSFERPPLGPPLLCAALCDAGRKLALLLLALPAFPAPEAVQQT